MPEAQLEIQTNFHLVKYKASNLTIEFLRLDCLNDPNPYYADIERCIDAASTLDWILHIHGKFLNRDKEAINAFINVLNNVIMTTFTSSKKKYIFLKDVAYGGATLNWETKIATFSKK